MKKKILFIILSSFMITGIVSAASSIWGEYKGKPIIRLTVDGVPIKVSDAPAVLMDDRTMVPIYLLKEAGIEYEWDGKNQTVDIKKSTPVKNESIDPVKLTNEIMSYNGGGVTIVEIAGELTAMTYFSSINGLEQDWERVINIFYLLTNFNAPYSRIVYVIGDNESTIEARTQDIKDRMNGKITDEQLSKLWITSGYLFQDNQSNIQQVEPTPTVNGSTNTTIDPQPSDSSNSNLVACQAIRDRHVIEDVEFERNNNPFSGRTVEKRNQLQAAQDAELAAAGC